MGKGQDWVKVQELRLYLKQCIAMVVVCSVRCVITLKETANLELAFFKILFLQRDFC